MRTIKLTESNFHKFIKSSVQRILKETYGIDNFGPLSDEEYDELQQKFVDGYEAEDEQMQDDYESSMADDYTNQDDNYDPSDDDLYGFSI